VAYCSRQAHSSVERAGMLAGITMRQLEPDHLFRCEAKSRFLTMLPNAKNTFMSSDVKTGLGTRNLMARGKEIRRLSAKHLHNVSPSKE
jgi:hypothetical protein